MNALDDLLRRARSDPRHIVLAEGEDRRVIEGAARIVREGVASLTLLGREQVIRDRAAESGIPDLPVAIVNPVDSERTEDYARNIYALRKHKGVTLDDAGKMVADPLLFANTMVRLGHASGSVAGARHTTADTVRAAIQMLGMRAGYSLVSSFFIMLFCEPYHTLEGALIFADCGLVVEPDSAELTQIAIVSADTARTMLGMEPRVAMLSFSTRGSARHPLADKVIAATESVREQRPDILIEGEVQLDVGIVPEVSARKAPDSRIAGRANVLIFPDLQAGNIGYKLVERLANAMAIGPILQGLAKPANDLSRGCNADDVYRVTAVTVVQAQSAEQ
ncbi:MAG: phosphate acetyltransferase [Gammaproteobacteria bacterium]|nr:MAG: phosphate acetyltransferase [Gammaproteobacteria bacterium]